MITDNQTIQWQVLFNAISHPAIILDRDHRIIAANSASICLTGIPQDKIIGRYCFEVFHHQNRTEPAAGCPMEKMLQSGVKEAVEMEMEALGRTFLITCTPILAEDGSIDKVIHIATDITERKLAEQALKSSHERFQTVLDNLEVIVYVADMESHEVLFINKHVKEIFGDITGQTCWKTIQADQSGPCSFCTNSQLVLTDGTPANPVVWEFQNTNNKRWYECRDQAIRWMDGRLVRLEIAADITARKEMEEKLSIETSFNKSIIGNGPEGLCVCHAVPEYPHVEFSVWNDRMLAITGYTLAEINSKGYYQTLFPDVDTQARAVARMQRMKIGDKLDGEEWRIISKQGQERVVAIWTTILTHSDGTENVMAFFVDVTEQRNALLEQRNFTSSLIRNSPVAMFVLDNNHHVRVWNTACENLTGCLHDEMMGSKDHWKAFYVKKQPTLADVVLDGDFARLPKLYTHVSRSIQNPNGYRAEGWFTQVNGKDRYFIIEAAPIYDRMGNRTHVLETISDLTDSKSLEEQLLQAQKMESIGHLSGGIAHEFNNILAVILGYGQVMRKGFEPDSINMNDLDQILTAAERAAVLTKGLLAFSRKQHVSLKNLDANILVHMTLKSFSRILGDDIIITENLGPVPLMIYADQALMTQVLMNLMANARDAMPDGGELTIHSRCAVIDEPFLTPFCSIPPGKYAHISVSDNGHGMDEEIVYHIFEPFFTTKDLGKGTGLGLSVVYGIVSQHKGYISVSSSPGQGTNFDLYFSLVEPQVSNRSAIDSPTGLRGGHETILLADDEATLLTLFSSFLLEMGYQVITATDGFDAVEKFTANQDVIKLLVLDVQMRRKNGLQAYAEIKRLQPGCKTLFISGFNAEQFQGDMALEEGTELLSKPFTPVDLACRVRKMLDTVSA